MAPEQREGKPADARSDIYSFGCVLHEMLTGVRPASQRKRIPSRRLEKIVSRCLAEDPARRWQSSAVLERELARVTPTNLWKWISAAEAALVLFAAAYMYLHRAPRLTDKDTLVLADFENKTGDTVFDDTLRQGLSAELQQSPFLTLISDEQVQQTLGLMKPMACGPSSPKPSQNPRNPNNRNPLLRKCLSFRQTPQTPPPAAPAPPVVDPKCHVIRRPEHPRKPRRSPAIRLSEPPKAPASRMKALSKRFSAAARPICVQPNRQAQPSSEAALPACYSC